MFPFTFQKNLHPSARNAAISVGSMTAGQKKHEGSGVKTNSHAVIYKKKTNIDIYCEFVVEKKMLIFVVVRKVHTIASIPAPAATYAII